MATASADAETRPPVKVWLGNRAPIEEIQVEVDGKVETQRRPIPVPKACTFVNLDPEGLLEQANDVRALWPHVSDDLTPVWVASTSPKLAELLSATYGGIEIREPEDPDVQHGPYKVVEPKKGR